jgi:hypothetical protein
MTTNGEEEDLNQHRRQSLERLDEVRHRRNGVGTTIKRRDGKGTSGIHAATQVVSKGLYSETGTTNMSFGNMPEDPVRHKSEKDFQFFSIDGHTVISWKHSTDEKKDVHAAASLEEFSAGYASERKSDWESFVHHSEIGLMPIETWKEKIAKELSVVTGSPIPPHTLGVSASGVQVERLAKCPNCHSALFVLTDGTCLSCHHKIL